MQQLNFAGCHLHQHQRLLFRPSHQSLGRMELKLKTGDIIWPGGSNVKPDGVKIPTHLKVLTLQEKPFVYSRRLEPGQSCSDSQTRCPWHNSTGGEWTEAGEWTEPPCPWHNSTGGEWTEAEEWTDRDRHRQGIGQRHAVPGTTAPEVSCGQRQRSGQTETHCPWH